MNVTEALKTIKPWIGNDPDRPQIAQPWAQEVAGRKTVMASDGAAIAWLWCDDVACLSWVRQYLQPDGSAIPYMDAPQEPPDAIKVLPPHIGFFDVTAEIIAARDVVQALPRAERTRKPIRRKDGDDVCRVVRIVPGEPVWTERVGTGRLAPIMLYAHYVANIPGTITAAWWYPHHMGALVLTDIGGVFIMGRRTA